MGGRALRLEVTGGKSRGLRGAEGQTEADDWLWPPLKETAQRKRRSRGKQKFEQKRSRRFASWFLRLNMCEDTLQIIVILNEPMIRGTNGFRNLCLLQVQVLPKHGSENENKEGPVQTQTTVRPECCPHVQTPLG